MKAYGMQNHVAVVVLISRIIFFHISDMTKLALALVFSVDDSFRVFGDPDRVTPLSHSCRPAYAVPFF